MEQRTTPQLGSQYVLQVKNIGTVKQNVIVFQDLSETDGLPVIFFQSKIGPGSAAIYDWTTNWTLSWGTTRTPLANGVAFTQQGDPVEVTPSKGTANSAVITYDEVFNIEKTTDSAIQDGELSVVTKDFNQKDAQHMQIAVGQESKPVFVIQGRPNGKYKITTKPRYYIAVTDHKQGTVVSADYISNHQQFKFDGSKEDDKFVVKAELKDNLTFDFVKQWTPKQ